MNSQIVLLPLGAWEQHGPHLPFDTDTIIIDSVVARALQDSKVHTNSFVIAPTIAISASDEHAGFSGTLSTGTEALVQSVVAICRSASWAHGVCIVNGHGGNADALVRISSALTYEKIQYSIWSLPSYDGADMHAGHTETSVMLHVAPDTVHTDRIERGTIRDASDLVAQMRTSGVAGVAANGVLGDPTTATKEHGIAVMNLYSSSLATHLARLSTEWRSDSQ
ncbi:MAG: mycofactocin biosynthesis peptidyl-dipeptidase MftE [Actinobacteria bacterium]|jgi:creatinine amidohydrolase|nr:mycofactocin biosynthesis peptidyl-dipeptidase MftE [Actinomycetota bacterium]